MNPVLPLVAAILLSACASPDDRSSLPATRDRAEPAAREDTARPVRLIEADGIGEARRGMTIAELRAALPRGTTLGSPEPFMVDVTGLPVVSGADTLYHVLVVGGEPHGDDAPVALVATTHPAVRTAEGVGAGIRVEDAESVYGAATFSYSTADESREYATFADHSAHTIRFRVDAGPGATGMAGVYTDPSEYNETTRYVASARISMVMVHLEPGAPD